MIRVETVTLKFSNIPKRDVLELQARMIKIKVVKGWKTFYLSGNLQ